MRNILTKATDLGARLGVVGRMSGNTRSMFRSMRPVSGSMNAMSGDMAEMSDNNGLLSRDRSTMPCDLSVMPGDIEAMSGNYAVMSLGSLLRSLNPLLLLRDLAAKLRYELNEWYWRKLGLSDPAERKIFQETDFDDLFTLEPTGVEVEIDYTLYRKFLSMPPPVHPLLAFLVAEKVPERDARKLLAVLLVLARKVLGITEPKRFWVLPWQFTLHGDSGLRPFSPRPPPLAA